MKNCRYYTIHATLRSFPPVRPLPPICDFDFWWSMNRYNILNLGSNEPWCWKCFSKLHDSFWMFAGEKAGGREFCGKSHQCFIDWSLRGEVSGFSVSRKSGKEEFEHVTMMKLSIKGNKFDFMIRQQFIFSVISTALQRHDRKLENESGEKALTRRHRITKLQGCLHKAFHSILTQHCLPELS